MEKKQTAVEWLFDQIPFEYTSSMAAFEAKKIAEQMFEEQIKEAYGDALNGHRNNYCNRDEYFNETFKK
jgi:hypothetical protein